MDFTPSPDSPLVMRGLEMKDFPFFHTTTLTKLREGFRTDGETESSTIAQGLSFACLEDSKQKNLLRYGGRKE